MPYDFIFGVVDEIPLVLVQAGAVVVIIHQVVGHAFGHKVAALGAEGVPQAEGSMTQLMGNQAGGILLVGCMDNSWP